MQPAVQCRGRDGDTREEAHLHLLPVGARRGVRPHLPAELGTGRNRPEGAARDCAVVQDVRRALTRVQQVVVPPDKAIGAATMKARTPAGLWIDVPVGLKFRRLDLDIVGEKFVRGLYHHLADPRVRLQVRRGGEWRRPRDLVLLHVGAGADGRAGRAARHVDCGVASSVTRGGVPGSPRPATANRRKCR